MSQSAGAYRMVVTAVGPERGAWWAELDRIFPDVAAALRRDGAIVVSEASWSYLGMTDEGGERPVRMAQVGSPGWGRDYREEWQVFS